jgi:dCMP deaminase
MLQAQANPLVSPVSLLSLLGSGSIFGEGSLLLNLGDGCMNRIDRQELLLDIAEKMALRSTCQRNQVGCVIAIDGRIVSTGYNGPPANTLHCDRHLCDIEKPCERSVHAEANAIAFAAKHGVALLGSELYVKVSPCKKCAELIINSGIKKVIYREEYRDTSGINLLLGAGLEVQVWK